MLETPEREERLSGALYGTVVVASVLAVAATDADPSAGSAALYATSTVVVFWLAHAWADAMATRTIMMSGGALPTIGRALARHWPLVQSVLPPLAVMGAAVVLGADGDDAIAIAVWSCVAFLAAWGAGLAWRESASPAWIVLSAVASGGLGVLVVILKALVH